MILTMAERSEFFRMLRDFIYKFILLRSEKDMDEMEEKVEKAKKKLIKAKKGRRRKLVKFNHRKNRKGGKGHLSSNRKNYDDVKAIQAQLASSKRGQVPSSDHRMINNVSVDKYDRSNERRSSQISSRIIEKHELSDSSKLDHILHAIRSNKQHIIKGGKDEMEIGNNHQEGSDHVQKITSENKNGQNLLREFKTLFIHRSKDVVTKQD